MKKASKIVIATLTATTAFATPATTETLNETIKNQSAEIANRETLKKILETNEKSSSQITHSNMHCENNGNGEFAIHADSFNTPIIELYEGQFNPFSNQVIATVDPQTVHKSVKQAFGAVKSLAIMDLGKGTCTVTPQIQGNEMMRSMKIHVRLKGSSPSN